MFHTLSILAGFPPSFVRPTTCAATQSRSRFLQLRENSSTSFLWSFRCSECFPLSSRSSSQWAGPVELSAAQRGPLFPVHWRRTEGRTDGRADGGGEVTCPMPPHRKNATASCFCSLLGGESTSCSEREGSAEVIEWWLVAVAVAASDQQGEKL